MLAQTLFVVAVVVAVVGQGIVVVDQGQLLDVSAVHGSCLVALVAVVLQIAAVEFLEVKVPVAVVVVGCQRFPEVVVAVVGDSTAVCQLVPFLSLIHI